MGLRLAGTFLVCGPNLAAGSVDRNANLDHWVKSVGQPIVQINHNPAVADR